MKSTLKFALVVLSFAFLTACGSKPAGEAAATDSVKTETVAPVEPAAPVATDSTATTDTTKKQ